MPQAERRTLCLGLSYKLHRNRVAPMGHIKLWELHLFPRLEQTVINLIKSGVCYFGAGGALGFDTMAAQTILSRETVTKYKPVD